MMWEPNPTAASGSQWTLIENGLNTNANEICFVGRNNNGNGCGFDFWAIPISTYGVIGYWKWVNTTTAEFWIYKHTASGGGDTISPSVVMTAPSGGATVSGTTVTVRATASDNIGVTGVQFKLDGANLGSEDTSSPYSITWNTTTTSNGSHALTATARDAAGNTTTATAVNVTVNNAGGGGGDFATRCAAPGVIR